METGAPRDPDPAVWILGQRYRSGAILDAEHETSLGGPSLELHAQPGTRAPHLWLERGGSRLALHDLMNTTCMLLTDADGEPWCNAAARVGAELALPLQCSRIGRASAAVELVDVEGAFHARYRLEPGAAVLIRPDGYVAWRGHVAGAADASDTLRDAIRRLSLGGSSWLPKSRAR
jgi:hypothetical protein